MLPQLDNSVVVDVREVLCLRHCEARVEVEEESTVLQFGDREQRRGAARRRLLSSSSGSKRWHVPCAAMVARENVPTESGGAVDALCDSRTNTI